MKKLEEIAEILRSTRIDAGIEISEVSKDLDISEVILKNIEEGKIGAFKDIFELKQQIADYAKYLGIDSEKLLDDFNEYLFEYTTRIPIKDIEKTLEQNLKENAEEEKVISPYSLDVKTSKKGIYILIYLLVLVLVILTIFWSVNQITVDNRNAYVVSYRK